MLTEVQLTVHRSAQEIGGNCIEIAVGGSRILLDVGRPLDAAKDAVGLLLATLDVTSPVDGIIISHPHQDHYGLLNEASETWPVFSGAATERLIKLTQGIFGTPTGHTYSHWQSGRPFKVGAFKITPFLTDHSAFDAYMLLIEAGGKRIFYSGDFRRHGRKGVLVDRLMAEAPRDIDALILEGTNLGSDKPWMGEEALESEFVTLFKETPGRVFVCWSGQNVDRTVTLYRACLQSGRTLVVDLYAAEVLDLLHDFGKLPQPDWRQVKVVVTSALSRIYKRTGREAFVERMAENGIAARKLKETPERWVSMIRKSLLPDFEAADVRPDARDSWSWSMWSGYLKNEDGALVQKWFDDGGARARHIHTSGHASPADLRAFAQSMKPKVMIPIHGLAWDGKEAEGFPTIKRLKDGEKYVV